MAGLEVATGLFAGCPITDGSELCAESRSALHGALASISGDRSGVSDPIHQCMGEDLEVEVRLSREADDWVLNFAGSSGASPGFVNATAEASHAAAVSAVASALGLPGLPNAGLVEGFRSEFPEDCFLNAKLPLSVGWSVYGPAPAIDQAVRRALDAEPVSRRPVEIALQVAGCGRSGCPFPISPRRMEESRA
ncbi:MAG: hypothetical protein GWO24_32495 [Akkermansiaceae bacterium]|nr:hypothetical protein [Akkermansiaceae bacterium]